MPFSTAEIEKSIQKFTWGLKRLYIAKTILKKNQSCKSHNVLISKHFRKLRYQNSMVLA